MARGRKPGSQTTPEHDPELVEAISQFFYRPLAFVLFAFPWGQPGTILWDEDGPDEWQARVLLTIERELIAGRMDAQSAIRLAVASGHGIGKTALVSWLILWFISTRPSPQIVVTANTVTQLTTKTWRELAKWKRLMLHGEWFEWTATKLYMKGRQEDWFASAVPWTKERAEAFAGTHEKHVLMIFDEASAIDDAIWEVAEGAMTTPGAMWIAFGNPTKNTGRFRGCFTEFRHRWIVMQIDSRSAKKANKKQIEDWIEDYGEDSDFVRIRVKGEFPRTSEDQFIPLDVVEEAASRRPFEQPETTPLIMMVDVARFGSDQSVIGTRCGKVFKILGKYREQRTDQIAHRVAEFIIEHQPDEVFIDEVGVGGGVCDTLSALGYRFTPVNGGRKAIQERRYFNRRTEMWDLMRQWLKDGGCIPGDDKELREDLTGPVYGFDAKHRLQLESKEDTKARGLASPDAADCLSFSFYAPVAPRTRAAGIAARLAALRNQAGGTWMSV